MELSRESYRAMIYYEFNVGLTEHQCMERLQKAFGNATPSPGKCVSLSDVRVAITMIIKRIASTRPPEAVFIEKALEVPVIVINEQDDVDLIGAPDPVSNLRPILRKIHLHETPLQQKLREMQDATQRQLAADDFIFFKLPKKVRLELDLIFDVLLLDSIRNAGKISLREK
ncbi:unnamed protein product [Acanthoscelides obtectus]|uniref:Uncharacterized protein n=1 Tax=Acanthoscelides obtectus TaxID=200917 RepID=A0A9P0MFX4_ACAOB|nr:unnamed protein product [Acanthoscelides obtectus]CAK1682381.1 hypothetical protein AOBTE_LOCUS33592 [Acanthoscelides obtectus]